LRKSESVFVLTVGLILVASNTIYAFDRSAIDIPAKFGIGLTLYNQTQPYEISSLQVTLPGLDPTQLQNLEVDNDTNSYHLRLDYWILPFLNVFGLVGEIDGKTTVNLQAIELGLPINLNNIVVDYDGTVYGAGLVLAAGGEKWFAAIAYDYTDTDLDVSNSSVEASIITPKLGLRTKSGAIWVGAMHQDAEERHIGTFDVPGLGPVPYDVILNEKEPWNWLIGATTGIGENWVLILQGGFGDRNAALVTLEYRL
jgi:hypothetical protein